MEAILSILYTAIFIFLIYKIKFFHFDDISKKVMSFLFLAKVLAGIALALIYTYYYGDKLTGDIHKYYQDGTMIFNALFENPVEYLKIVTGIGYDDNQIYKSLEETTYWYKSFNYELYNDNRTVIRFNAIISLFSFGSFYVHTVFMAFLSFIGFAAILKIFIPIFRDKKTLLLISIFLLPSVIFWSSSILKEGVLMFGFGLLFYSFIKMVREKLSVKIVILFLFSLFILLISKFYVLVAATPGLLFLLLIYKSKNRFLILKFLAVHLLLVLIAANTYRFSKYDFINIVHLKQQDFLNSVEATKNVGSTLAIPEFEPSLIGILKAAPHAFVNTYFRPHIFESYSVIVLLAALENLLIVLMTVLCFIFPSRKIPDKPLFLFSISFVIMIFVLSGLTTPVMGALVRYKIPALPFLFIIFITLIDTNRITEIIKRSYYKIFRKT
jgi:hypothetical protein